MGKAELETQFLGRSDSFWGITDTDDGSLFSHSGLSGVNCMGYALEIQRQLGAGRVSVVGYQSDPQTPTAAGADADGHDFAIVDGRYIVDPWAHDVANISEHGVLDLKDARDAAEIERLYGPRSSWAPVPNKAEHPSQGRTESVRDIARRLFSEGPSGS